MDDYNNNNNNNYDDNMDDNKQWGNNGDDDMAERANEDKGFLLGERVKTFIAEFYNKMCDNNVSSVRFLYYKEWSNLTQMYYKDTEWPNVDEISSLCDNNEIFLLCYKELYYRHIFVNGDPLIHHRFESWNNYCSLFDMFLDGGMTQNLRLPLEWCTDMIDEFLYQFQDFCQYRQRLGDIKPEEISILEENKSFWKLETVLGYLNSLIHSSNIIPLLKTAQESNNATRMSNVLDHLSVTEALGYYSIVGLCRLHCLLGDYRMATRVLEPIDIDDKRGLFTRVTACHMTLFYYLGFAYLMMRRYSDAVNTFSIILLAHGTSKNRAACFADSQINNKYDKICVLTAIAYSLSPGLSFDPQVRSIVMEKYGDTFNSMMKREGNVFQDHFFFACPKFITPSTPNYTGGQGQNKDKEAFQLQLKGFMNEVRQQSDLPRVRSYLKLYKSITIEKLAKFCNINEDSFRANLISMKYKEHEVTHSKLSSPALSGVRKFVSGLNYHVVGNMVHISESRVAPQYGQYFINHSVKFQQAIEEMEAPNKENAYDANKASYGSKE